VRERRRKKGGRRGRRKSPTGRDGGVARFNLTGGTAGEGEKGLKCFFPTRGRKGFKEKKE